MTSDLKKGSWSVEEDQKLISYIKRYGIWNWSQMPKYAGLSRSGKSCRLRWVNYLKPNLKKGEFSKYEEETLLHYHSLLGNRWSVIASKLPGRTDNDVKNYWHAHLKKRVSEQKQVCQENENNSSPSFEDIEQPAADYMNEVFETSFSFEQDIISSSCTTTYSGNHVIEFRDNYYDSSSPGTIDDHHCFWDQLHPFQNLDYSNNDHHMGATYDHVFQDSNSDPISEHTLYNNNYNYSLCPLQNLDYSNNIGHQMGASYDHIFQDSNSDPISEYTLYDNYNYSFLSDP